DVVVRHAINHAVNKHPIVSLVYQGMAVEAKGPVPPSMWSYRDDIADYPYDPARAKQLLAEEEAAGRFDPHRVYTLYVPRSPPLYLPGPERIARAIQKNLAEVGIQTQLIVQEMGAHLADVQSGHHDLCLLGWQGDNGDPDNFLFLLLDRENTQPGFARNVAFYDNGELHGLLRYAQETMDRGERTSFYRKAQEIVARDPPWVPLAHSETAVAARADVLGLEVHPSGIIYYEQVSLGP